MGGQTNESSVIALLSVLARTSSGKCSPLMLKARHARGAPWRRRPSLILHIHIWSYPSERVTLMNCKTLPQDEWQDTKQEFSVLLWLCNRHYLSVLFLVGVGFWELRGDLQVVFRCRCEEFALSIWWGSPLSRLCPKIRRFYLNRIVYFAIERFLFKDEHFY